MKASYPLWLMAAALLVGCPDRGGDPTPLPDVGRGDAAPTDAAPTDAAPTDAAPTDAAPTDAAPGRDTGAADAATDSSAADVGPVPDAGPEPLSPPMGFVPAPLFDPDAPDATEHDAPLARLVLAWRASPASEEEARANELALAESSRALVAGGAEAADRVVERCEPAPVHARDRLMVCFRLLSLVESPRSIDWLARMATLEARPWPEGAHPHDPSPQALAAQVATWALGRRARDGSARALDQLRRLVASPDVHDRRHAVRAVFDALPRFRAKKLLRDALPADEHWRLYQWR